MSKEIAEEYASSLADLTVNSKPLINMLTILAEENIDHAGVIVETVEKHLEKVHPDIKLPVLYLVDSIIKNVSGAYTQKFAQSIVNMFTRTFKQVDEKVRSQMFKLRETWHDVFPATKLYQLDVKVNLIDPAWPIQAQPHQSNIHVNPNFLKKTVPTNNASSSSSAAEAPPASLQPMLSEEELNIIAKKEQELLMLQKQKIEMELEQTRKQLELAEKNAKKITTINSAGAPLPSMPIALVNPVHSPPVMAVAPEVVTTPVKQRLGPPVNKIGGRIAPVSAALVSARRDPRLARRQPAPASTPAPGLLSTPVGPPNAHASISPNVFDIKPLERAVTKRKNVITIDVRTDVADVRQATRDPRRREPRDQRDGLNANSRPQQRDSRREQRARARRRDLAERAPPPPALALPLAPAPLQPDSYIDKLQLADPRRINKLPPIPKINRDEQPHRERDTPAPKRRKEGAIRDKKKKGEETNKEDSLVLSPEKRGKSRENKKKREPRLDPAAEVTPGGEIVQFKELKNYHKERYMRRNKEKSLSPEVAPTSKETERASTETDVPNEPELIVENKDVDLRVLPPVVETHAAPVVQKRSSTETLEGKAKKPKVDKFDILFGNEDVDLRKLPQVEEIGTAPPPPVITESSNTDEEMNESNAAISPSGSPKQKDWHEVKEKREKSELKKTPSKLDLVRAKLAEATKGKDRLGRPLLFSKSPSIEKERRRTLSSEDTDLRNENGEDFDAEDNKKTISIIMSQAKEQFSDGQLDKNQYNTLMYQVLQLNEKLKLKEAKQRESLEVSKRKLKAHVHEENNKVPSPKSSPSERNNFGDIDERINPSAYMDSLSDGQSYMQSSDVRNNHIGDGIDGTHKSKGLLPCPPMMPLYPFQPMWRGQPRPRTEDFMARRFRGPIPPYFRGKFDKRGPRPTFDVRPLLPLPTPKIGMCQGECPLQPYERTESPPPLGAPGYTIPPTDFKILEYIDQDPVKTIQIDGVPREIRFYGSTAVIMLDWDDPREIKFLPGCRRVTFDNKDSVVLSFNEGYKQVEIDEQVFDIKFGAPTRELYINGRWYECFFGGQPLGVIIDGKPRLVHLEGPLPQVDIGKTKRTDLVAGKINLIVNATQICPVYLDAKVQKFAINGQFFTIRFVDLLKTVLINEQPFKIEYGDLPKPITIGNEKYFIRFSALPRNIKPGVTEIANMEGTTSSTITPVTPSVDVMENLTMETEQDLQRPVKTPSPDMNIESQGLELLASVMPSTIAPASASEYSVAEPLFAKPDTIPGLETSTDEKPNSILPILGNINVTDLFAKLVASGIVHVPSEKKKEDKQDPVAEDAKIKQRDDKNAIHRIDWFKPETFRGKQPGLVVKLYGGMQCSGCGARFPPEHTVRYSQHLDWHFRQNRRERDSARRAHSRHWHYDLSDWLQYEELEELDEREKNWFENGGAEGAVEGSAGGVVGVPGVETNVDTPSVAAGPPHSRHCALCGDCFDQFYNEDKEEWHLRNSVTHEDKYYHPLCLEDYKASQTKEEPVVEEPPPEIKIQESIEIKDADETLDQSDNESVVEVVEPNELELMEPVEIDEGSEPECEADGDEDDVVLKAEPIEQVVVQDDADTDDETTAERADRDRKALIDFTTVRVKQEPIDPDDEPIITAEDENILAAGADMMHTTVLSSIDGNTQLESTTPANVAVPLGGIRINISKSISSAVIIDDKIMDDISADEEPMPPGEEPELQYKLKPSLEGVQFSRQPPVQKDKELSGLCSIM